VHEVVEAGLLLQGVARQDPEIKIERNRGDAALVMDLVAEALPRLSQAAGRHNLAQGFEGIKRGKGASPNADCRAEEASQGRSLRDVFTAFG